MNSIIFSVPGSKIYINRHYKNNPNSFINISLTGAKCQLMCSHCKALLLKDMVDINNSPQFKSSNKSVIKSEIEIKPEINPGIEPNRLQDIINNFGPDNVNGILVSGGFDKSGRLPLDLKVIEEMKELKCLVKEKIKIFIHLGFVNDEEIKQIKGSCIDGALVNIFSDRHAIEEVYNLKGFAPQDFYINLKKIKSAGIKVAPHLILGLGGRQNTKGEFASIDEISKTGSDGLVFAIEKKLSKSHRLGYSEVYANDVIKLFEYAKTIMPDVPLALGCARPPGPVFENLEIELLKRGVDSIAFPSERTVDFAIENGIDFKFTQQCCAFP
jgi:uncharacterized radical SAM superfamily protein